MSSAGKTLTPKQRAFVDQYLIDLNGTAAAIRAGFSAKSAKAKASQLLAMDHVAEAIAARQVVISNRLHVTQERVVAELAKIGFSDIRKAISWKPFVTEMDFDDDTGEQRLSVTNQVQIVGSDDIDDDTAAAIAEISQTDKGGLKIKLHDKRAALVDLGKHLGMFVDKVEHSGSMNLVISPEDAEL
ncbi:MAG TPA: terminase small subunit [Ramlibacter sp.]|jgi:phage terminase small subunit